jgi:hypothetical protein
MGSFFIRQILRSKNQELVPEFRHKKNSLAKFKIKIRIKFNNHKGIANNDAFILSTYYLVNHSDGVNMNTLSLAFRRPVAV